MSDDEEPRIAHAAPLGTARGLVVVPTLNEARGIEACLISLMRGCGLPIVVSDGGSTDGTQATVEKVAASHPRLRLVSNPRRSQAAAVNDVARAAAGSPALVRCDAHALYPPGFAEGVLNAMDARRADGLAVPMDAHARDGAGPFARAVAMVVDTRLGSGGSAHRGGTRSGWVDHGHHAGLRLAPFLALGGYDESLIANEDAEYDTRLARWGGRVWLEASLRVRYFVRESPGALWRQYHAYGRGRAAHVRRHRIWPRLRQLAPAIHVILFGSSLLIGTVWAGALSYAAFYGAVLGAASVCLALRRRDPAGLLAGPALAVMHIGWGLGFWRGLASFQEPACR